jgi:hypothetical protein
MQALLNAPTKKRSLPLYKKAGPVKFTGLLFYYPDIFNKEKPEQVPSLFKIDVGLHPFLLRIKSVPKVYNHPRTARI